MLAVNQNYGSEIGKECVPCKAEKFVAFDGAVDLFREIVTGSYLLPEVNNMRLFEYDACWNVRFRRLGRAFLAALC
mgnify:CR=1 FL=1